MFHHLANVQPAPFIPTMTRCENHMSSLQWWRSAVIYQIYPRSFQDSNKDGIGDLRGITTRLDYLHWLGIDCIWISPMYPSPMADFGYDVSDYCDVDPKFGTLEDMKELVAAAHALQIRVVLDFVPNHSSNQHPWFLEARKSPNSPKRDWYFFREPASDGAPPNNWLSRFGGGSAWEWDEEAGQYYLHTFLKEQPDLNWRNDELREEMLNVLRFWMDLGIDGFRVDVSDRAMKDPELPNNPPNPQWKQGMDPGLRLLEKYNKNTPDIHWLNQQLRTTVDERADKVLIGEMNLPLEALVRHYGIGNEIHLPFNFHLITCPWNASSVKALVDKYEGLLPSHGWPTWVVGNHDVSRAASRLGEENAALAMLLLLTLRGTPTLYYGDELGMKDGVIPRELVQDPWELLSPGLGLGRDPARTPMQWDSTENAAFTAPDVQPWLPVQSDSQSRNVSIQKETSDSMLCFTRSLLMLRRSSTALSLGDYRPLNTCAGLFAYERTSGSEKRVIALNFTAEPVELHLSSDNSSYPISLITPHGKVELLDSPGHRFRLGALSGVVLGAS